MYLPPGWQFHGTGPRRQGEVEGAALARLALSTQNAHAMGLHQHLGNVETKADALGLAAILLVLELQLLQSSRQMEDNSFLSFSST